mmetsp:Transcript_129654/g.415839  ORF Transcript_129654/g.415839 Transcript_129654/m.415839 type:complete len:250 (+) Transcript_129654:526-1275(+)
MLFVSNIHCGAILLAASALLVCPWRLRSRLRSVRSCLPERRHRRQWHRRRLPLAARGRGAAGSEEGGHAGRLELCGGGVVGARRSEGGSLGLHPCSELQQQGVVHNVLRDPRHQCLQKAWGGLCHNGGLHAGLQCRDECHLHTEGELPDTGVLQKADREVTGNLDAAIPVHHVNGMHQHLEENARTVRLHVCLLSQSFEKHPSHFLQVVAIRQRLCENDSGEITVCDIRMLAGSDEITSEGGHPHLLGV